MKKRNNQQANITPHAPLPYSPPNYARDVPYDPAYHPAQPAQVTLAQPMPYDIVATLGRKNSNDSMWKKWHQTKRKSYVPQDISVYTHWLKLRLSYFLCYMYDTTF